MLAKHRTALVLTLLCASASLPACYIDDEGPPAVSASSYGYTPQYYDGYVVYYDGVGRPFYHVGGVPVWVPQSSPYYVGLTNHWRTYGPAYGRWSAHYGWRYRGYRAGVGYRR